MRNLPENKKKVQINPNLDQYQLRQQLISTLRLINPKSSPCLELHDGVHL
jgi:hypothetical protein